jgi:hypothetical protein
MLLNPSAHLVVLPRLIPISDVKPRPDQPLHVCQEWSDPVSVYPSQVAAANLIFAAAARYNDIQPQGKRSLNSAFSVTHPLIDDLTFSKS